MTKDRDFKNVVRARTEKTGESYQTARRQLDRPDALSAPVYAVWASPLGLILGCHVEKGQIVPGKAVTVMADEAVLHQGTVVSLRVGREDREVVTDGDCGVILDPPFHGYAPIQEDAPSRDDARDHYPVEVVPLPYLVVDAL